MPVFFLQARVYDNNTIHSINITLVNVSRDDNNFLLTCTATNIVGMTNASVQLTVHCKYVHTHAQIAPLLVGCYIFHLIALISVYKVLNRPSIIITAHTHLTDRVSECLCTWCVYIHVTYKRSFLHECVVICKGLTHGN